MQAPVLGAGLCLILALTSGGHENIPLVVTELSSKSSKEVEVHPMYA